VCRSVVSVCVLAVAAAVLPLRSTAQPQTPVPAPQGQTAFRVQFQGASAPGTRAAGARVAVDTLTELSEYLAGMKGRRKMCVYFSQGFPGPASDSAFRDLTNAANRGNVSMYTLNPGGLADLANLVTADQPSVLQNEPRPGAPAAERAARVRNDGMRRLAEETGGLAIVGTNNIDGGLDRIQQEASSYYLLGYYPTATRSAWSAHTIAVHVRNRPDVGVRARRGYVVPVGSAPSGPPPFLARGVPPKLLPALQYPLPQGGIRVSAMASPFRGETGSPWANVTLQFDGRDLDLSPSGALDVAVLAVDAQGIVRGHDVRRLDLSFDTVTQARVVEGGLRLQARVAVAPDAIGIRVAAADAAGPRVGSLWFDLDVPDYERAPLSMSDILLSDSTAGTVLTANADAGLRQANGSERASRLVARTPLAGYAPGAYVLRIEAGYAGAPGTVSRELLFQVVEAAR
jgi:hypothetical protein